MTVIEIRPHRWGWKVFEAPGVEPAFPLIVGFSYFLFSRVQLSVFVTVPCCLRPRFTKQTGK
jgi:hypothetical protein